ncbi:hypothetical protein JOF53_007313 [Crossiella equi]|uniref:non-specific serine/threonine protein kinase n=1 Tax=Crossiella equi TaxID=130796 RepID=A0ABS5APF4_9PSEU|nr:serine/threonine-protein kinase [Crossiella equi]MBP2478441.1 hypothetical protein [Crossiella equi]
MDTALDNTAASFPERDELDRQLPGYRFTERISATDMSEVWLAEELAMHGRRLAVKILPQDLAERRQFRHRFLREVQVLCQLQHPHIIPISATTAPGEKLLYLAMPFVDGPNLRQLIREKGGLDPGRALRIVVQLAAALDHAHRNGIVHRDVKPGNVLVAGPTDHVYLCDFGIAAEVAGEPLTHTGLSVGTRGYMAPERYRGRADTPATDIYGLGVVLHECLTGRVPFRDSDPDALEWAQRAGEPEPVSAVRRDVPRAVDAVVRKAMAPEPGDRYRSAGELAEALRDALTPRRSLRLPRFGRRTLLTAAATAAVLTAAVVVVPRLGSGIGDTPGAEQLARVPEALRGECVIAGPTTLSCVDGGRRVRVEMLADAAATENAYQQALRESGVPRATGDCAVATRAEHRYPAAGRPKGRVLCWTTGGRTTVLWTDEAARTLARAETPDTQELDLRRAWQRWAALPAFPGPAEDQLANLLGLADCRRPLAASLDAYAGLAASLDCEPDRKGVTSVTYHRFDDVDRLRAAFDREATPVNAPAEVYCDEPDKYFGNDTLDIRSVELGRRLCYADKGQPVLVWTMEPFRLLARVTGTDAKAMISWFNNNFGEHPSATAIAKAVNEQADPAFPNPGERELLQRIPEPTRVNCMRPPRRQVTLNVGQSEVTALVCGPGRGAPIVFYYRFRDLAAMQAQFGKASEAKGADCTGFPADFRGNAAYAKEGGRGALVCALNGKGPYLAWSNEDLNIVAMAFGATDRQVLVDWWRTEAGPR